MSVFDRFRTDRGRAPLELVLYTRQGCHLCEEMKAQITDAGLRAAYTLSEVDIDSDPELVERFGLSIPVLSIDGRIAFKGRLTVDALRRKVERALSARGDAQA